MGSMKQVTVADPVVNSLVDALLFCLPCDMFIRFLCLSILVYLFQLKLALYLKVLTLNKHMNFYQRFP